MEIAGTTLEIQAEPKPTSLAAWRIATSNGEAFLRLQRYPRSSIPSEISTYSAEVVTGGNELNELKTTHPDSVNSPITLDIPIQDQLESLNNPLVYIPDRVQIVNFKNGGGMHYPKIEAHVTSKSGSSPSGIDLHLELMDKTGKETNIALYALLKTLGGHHSIKSGFKTGERDRQEIALPLIPMNKSDQDTSPADLYIGLFGNENEYAVYLRKLAENLIGADKELKRNTDKNTGIKSMSDKQNKGLLEFESQLPVKPGMVAQGIGVSLGLREQLQDTNDRSPVEIKLDSMNAYQLETFMGKAAVLLENNLVKTGTFIDGETSRIITQHKGRYPIGGLGGNHDNYVAQITQTLEVKAEKRIEQQRPKLEAIQEAEKQIKGLTENLYGKEAKVHELQDSLDQLNAKIADRREAIQLLQDAVNTLSDEYLKLVQDRDNFAGAKRKAIRDTAELEVSISRLNEQIKRQSYYIHAQKSGLAELETEGSQLDAQKKQIEELNAYRQAELDRTPQRQEGIAATADHEITNPEIDWAKSRFAPIILVTGLTQRELDAHFTKTNLTRKQFADLTSVIGMCLSENRAKFQSAPDHNTLPLGLSELLQTTTYPEALSALIELRNNPQVFLSLTNAMLTKLAVVTAQSVNSEDYNRDIFNTARTLFNISKEDWPEYYANIELLVHGKDQRFFDKAKVLTFPSNVKDINNPILASLWAQLAQFDRLGFSDQIKDSSSLDATWKVAPCDGNPLFFAQKMLPDNTIRTIFYSPLMDMKEPGNPQSQGVMFVDSPDSEALPKSADLQTIPMAGNPDTRGIFNSPVLFKQGQSLHLVIYRFPHLKPTEIDPNIIIKDRKRNP